MRSVCRDSRSSQPLGNGGSRWSPASGDSQDAKAAATMEDLDTPFWRQVHPGAWRARADEKIEAVLAHRSIPSLGSREAPAGPCAWPGRAGREAGAPGRRHRAAPGRSHTRPTRLVGDGFESSSWRRGPPSSVPPGPSADTEVGAGYGRGCRRRSRRAWRRVGVPPDLGRWQDAILEIGVDVVTQLLRADRGTTLDTMTRSSGGSCITSPGVSSGRAVSDATSSGAPATERGGGSAGAAREARWRCRGFRKSFRRPFVVGGESHPRQQLSRMEWFCPYALSIWFRL